MGFDVSGLGIETSLSKPAPVNLALVASMCALSTQVSWNTAQCTVLDVAAAKCFARLATFWDSSKMQFGNSSELMQKLHKGCEENVCSQGGTGS